MLEFLTKTNFSAFKEIKFPKLCHDPTDHEGRVVPLNIQVLLNTTLRENPENIRTCFTAKWNN